MNFVVFAQRSATLQPERIILALDKLQQENALLQTRIDWSEERGLRFEPAPGQPIALHCQPTTTDDWQGVIERELAQPFASGSAPLMRCLYLENKAACSSVLALSFHHAIADGRSGTALLRRLLSLLANTRAATPTLHPAALPAMTEVFPARYRWAEQPEAAKALRHTLIGDYRRHGALPPIPWLAAQASARTPRFIPLVIPQTTSGHLLARARTENTTVHGLLCAAQLLAQHRLQAQGEASTFFLSCPIDMRAHLEPPQPAAPTGLFVSLISNTFQVGTDSNIWTLARAVMAQTRRQIARGEGHLLYWLYGLTGAPVLPSHMDAFRAKALASLPNTMVSNVGAIDTVVDDPAVEAISFALCPMPYQTLFTAASSYRGRLILNVGFDAQRVSLVNAQALAEDIQALLLGASD